MIHRQRPGLTLVELLVGLAVAGLALGGLGNLLIALGGHINPILKDPSGKLSPAMERLERGLRTATDIIYPPPNEMSKFVYMVNTRNEGVLMSFSSGVLYQTVIAGGRRQTTVIASGLDDACFGTVPGKRPRVRIALEAGDCLVVGQVLVLNADPPLLAGD
jgi:prepilin-type N-terminal cleavage/methylation domain-containing protein